MARSHLLGAVHRQWSLGLLLPVAVLAQEASLALEADRAGLAAGETLSVAVVVRVPRPITSASAFVSFDDQAFELVPQDLDGGAVGVPFRPGPFLGGQVLENSTAGDGSGEGNGLAGFQLNYVAVQAAGPVRGTAAGQGVLAWFALRAKPWPSAGQGWIRLDNGGKRRPVYTEPGQPGVEQRFDRVAEPLAIRLEAGGPMGHPEGTTPQPIGGPTTAAAPAGQDATAALRLAPLGPLQAVMGGESSGPWVEELLLEGPRDGQVQAWAEGDGNVLAWITDGRLWIRGLAVGEGSVWIEVSDGNGRTAGMRVAVSVRDPGQGPALAAVDGMRLEVGAERAVLLGDLAEDPDTPTAELAWEALASGPLTAWVDTTGGAVLRIRGVQAGAGRVDLGVSDPEGNTAAASIRVDVHAPVPVAPVPPPSTVAEVSEPRPPVAPAVPVDTLATAVCWPQPEERPGTIGAQPNPFNGEVVLGFFAAEEGPARLWVCDARGARIRCLLEAWTAAGPVTARWNGISEDGRPAASGVYLLCGEGAARHVRGKVLLLR